VRQSARSARRTKLKRLQTENDRIGDAQDSLFNEIKDAGLLQAELPANVESLSEEQRSLIKTGQDVRLAVVTEARTKLEGLNSQFDELKPQIASAQDHYSEIQAQFEQQLANIHLLASRRTREAGDALIRTLGPSRMGDAGEEAFRTARQWFVEVAREELAR
jgi:phage-related minor tail protein